MTPCVFGIELDRGFGLGFSQIKAPLSNVTGG